MREAAAVSRPLSNTGRPSAAVSRLLSNTGRQSAAVSRLLSNTGRPSAAKRGPLATVVYDKLLRAAEMWAYTGTSAASSRDALCRPGRSVALIRAYRTVSNSGEIGFLESRGYNFLGGRCFVIY